MHVSASLTFLIALLCASLAAPAQPADRQVRFASVLGHSVINEVRTRDTLFFERCAYHHVDGLNVVAELSAHAFIGCRGLGLPQPLAARAGILKTIDEALSLRRKDLADPNVLVWAAQGAAEGALIGGLGFVGLRRLLWSRNYGLAKIRRDLVRVGGLGAAVVGATRARRAIGRRGQNQALLDLFDPTLPTGLYLLDQRTDDKLIQMRAMDNIAAVIDEVMESYVP